ncbi:hypothetical protein ACFYTF_29430 [Nocardia thailandica]|uniref:Minor tail protein n=1 Tax=Nocardia thailandica TaxID=257275 RepID=A0ABW6PX07_9NOCA
MREDAPLPSVDYADQPVSRWRADAPGPTVEVIPGVPAGVVTPDGVVANFTGVGLAVAALIAKPGLHPTFTGRGELAAAVSVKVSVLAVFTGAGTVDLSASLPARFTGAGVLSAIARPGRQLGAGFTGSGALTAGVLPVGTTTAPYTGSGLAVGAIGVAVAAAFTGVGTLSAVALGGIPVAAAFTGAGVLSATTSYRYAVAAAFTGSGALAVTQQTFSVTADFTGSGTLAATATKVGVSLADDFNRADGALGSNWTAASTAPTIATNRSQAGNPGGTNLTVVYAARHNTVLATDSQEVSVVLTTATANGSTALSGGAFLRSTTGGDRVEIAIISGTVQILSFIAGVRTQRAVNSSIGTPTSGRMTAVGNVYTAYINGSGTAACTWTDSGNLIAIGSTTRSVGHLTVGQTNGIGQLSRGYAIDSWAAADIV